MLSWPTSGLVIVISLLVLGLVIRYKAVPNR